VNLQIYPWQQTQWNRLETAFANNRLPHALLLAGPAGLGLEHFAQCLVARWLCLDPVAQTACGKCRSCQLFVAGNHPDINRVEPEETGKQIKVDAVRELLHFIQLSSQFARGKMVIIAPAEAMNRSAANSLLKTLEEPPAGSFFILVSHQPAFLPVTIRSRCQRLNFAPTHEDSALQWLGVSLAIDKTKAADILTLSHGCPLLAMSLVENDVVSKQSQVLSDLSKLDNSSSDVGGTAQRWHDLGANEVFEWLQMFFASMARLKITGLQPSQAESVLVRDLQRLANRLDLQVLMRGYDMAFQNYRAVTGPYNLNHMGLLEEFIVYWQYIIGSKGGKQE